MLVSKVFSKLWKVDRVTANHSLSSTASQGTSNIPFPCFLVLGCNRQAQEYYFYLLVSCLLIITILFSFNISFSYILVLFSSFWLEEIAKPLPHIGDVHQRCKSLGFSFQKAAEFSQLYFHHSPPKVGE